MRVIKTRYMNATITRLGEKLYRIDVHSSRTTKRVRRMIKGTTDTAKRSIETIRQRENAGRFGWPTETTMTVSQLTRLVVENYQANRYKSLRSAITLERFWNGVAGSLPASSITEDRLTDWAAKWTLAGLSQARVNRRMAFLLRGFRLAFERKPPLVSAVPTWKKLKEAPPRTGYRTWQEFVNVRSLLPAHARIPVTIEYWCGMREGEVLSLAWSQVTFNEREENVEIRLHGEDTKTGEQRMVVMGGDLYDVLRAWYKETARSHAGCGWVCHQDGQRLKSMKTSWRTACVKAGLGRFRNTKGKYVGNRGYEGALIHDFRRTAVTNMEDAGVPRKVRWPCPGIRPIQSIGVITS